MEIKHFTFLFLLIIVGVVPLIFSFEKRIKFYLNQKYLIPAIIFSGAIFILWDIRFTELGIWSFNNDFITGVKILNLPIEEWLFFIIIPYSSVFIYEFLKIKFTRFEKPNIFLAISLVILLIFIVVAWFFRQKLYTFFTFFLLSVYFGYTIFRNRFKAHYTKFYLAYIISLVPYFILRVAFTSLPIITYNNAHLLSARILNVPLEDFGYFFLLLLMNITIFEYLKERRFY